MPPKKQANKATGKNDQPQNGDESYQMFAKKQILIELPKSKYSERPAEFFYPKEPGALYALMPWLARGFAPAFTSGQNWKCGLKALAKSYRAARIAINGTQAKIDHATIKDFENYLRSDEYSQKVEEILQGDAYGALEENEIEEVRRYYHNKNNLDRSQLDLLLKVANKKKGTNFVLGVVVQGHRCRYNRDSGEYDNEYEKKTSIFVEEVMTAEERRRATKDGSNYPPSPVPAVIWI
jgi:hypothetical protein